MNGGFASPVATGEVARLRVRWGRFEQSGTLALMSVSVTQAICFCSEKRSFLCVKNAAAGSQRARRICSFL